MNNNFHRLRVLLRSNDPKYLQGYMDALWYAREEAWVMAGKFEDKVDEYDKLIDEVNEIIERNGD